MTQGTILYHPYLGKLVVTKKGYSAVKNAVIWYAVDQLGEERPLDGTETTKVPKEEPVKVENPFEGVKMIKGAKGEKGDPGKTPIAGIDYYSKQQVETLVSKEANRLLPKLSQEKANVISAVVQLIPTPKDGKDGKTPVKGVDYFTKEDTRTFITEIITKVREVVKDGKDGKEGKAPKHRWIGTKLQFKLPDGTWGEEVDLKGLDGLNGGGGIHEIRHATDVNYSTRTTTNGQALIWNATTSKWEPGTVAGSGSGAWGNITGNLSDQTDLQTALDAKQDTLVSGTNIKTINSTSLLGSGDIAVSASPGGSDTQVQFNDSSSLGGDAGFTYNKTSNVATLGGLVTPDIHTVDANTGTNIDIIAGAAVSSNNEGGYITLASGNGSGTQDGGGIGVYAGDGGATGDGGYFEFVAGGGGATSGNGGAVSIHAGRANGGNGNGGDVALAGGEPNGSGTRGKVKIINVDTNLGAVLNIDSIASTSKTFTFPNNTGTFALGSGTANELTYWTSANVLGTLTTATYPSLTELAYVKGVTSAIQTQINAKVTGPSSATNNGVALYDSTTGKLIKDSGGLTFSSNTLNNGAGITVSASGVSQAKLLSGSTGLTILEDNAPVGASLNTSLDMNGNDIIDIDDLFLNEGGVINWDNGDATLTQTGNTVALAGASLSVPDDAYDATNWNGSVEVPTKNAVRDKIETLQPLDADLTTLATAFTTASSSGAASLKFHEDTDNGSNAVTLQGPASTADVTITLPATAGTVQLQPSEGAFVNGDKTKLDGIEALADVTDATNVAAAGAVMESDTSTASMSFVVDEDDMVSNSATKVPTQQSVKAYVDANAGGGVDTANSPNANEFARFTDADTIEGRTPAEVRADLDLEIGTDVQAYDADLTTWAGITPGTGVGTALAVNTGSAGAFVVNGGALGTPSSGTATNLTGTASGLTAGNVTTNANLTGPITSVGNATAVGLTAFASLKGSEGFLVNGKLSVTISSSDLVVALVTASGGTPSASDPIYATTNDAVVAITAALSTTKADATNWFGSGSSDFAATPVPYFVYLINETGASAGLKIGFARIPYARTMNDFVNTNTDEKYIAGNWTNFNTTDVVTNIGSFRATLSASAGHVWSAPTDIITQPTYSAYNLTWIPTWGGYSAAPGGTYRYSIEGRRVTIETDPTNGTSNATSNTMTAPFKFLYAKDGVGLCGNGIDAGSRVTTQLRGDMTAGSKTITFYKDLTGTAWTSSATAKLARLVHQYLI